MHMSLVAVVYAKDQAQAVKKGTRVFEQLSCKECQRPFDYFVVGRTDWPESVQADSDEGKDILRKAMEFTKCEFLICLRRLREALAKVSDEEAWSQSYPDLKDDVRFLAHHVGQYKGSNIYVYDNDSEGIREPVHLKNALEKWPGLDDRSTRERLDNAGDVWLVTADAHH